MALDRTTLAAVAADYAGRHPRDILALAIREEGVHVDAIRFPAVPIKSARLRIQLNAGHRREDIDHLVEVLKRHQHLAEPARRFVAARGKRAATLEPSPSL